MARKVEVRLVDDLDGGEAEDTLAFALDGTDYEIDLSNGNAARLRDALAPYVQAARKTVPPSRQRAKATGRKAATKDGPNTAEVREWAKTHGIEISHRGRIPTDVYVKFQDAQGA